MAALGVQFDASKVAPYEPGSPVWEGRVPCMIMKSEIKATAANDGQNILIFHVKAMDAPYIGQENLIRLNLYNRNPVAVDIAQRQLSSICHVTGVMNMTDGDQAIGKPFIGVWERQSREVTDQATGVKKMIDGCQCNNFAFIDGRTIKEAMAGQAPSNPYIPGQTGLQEAAARVGGAAAPQNHQPAPPAPPAQGGFGGAPQGGGQAAPQAGFQPPTQPQGGAPSATGGAFGQSAPGQPSGQPMQPAGGFGTAASGFNPAQGGGQPQQGFAPPQQGGQPQGFQPPAGGQPGPGPWGGGQQPQGGFGAR